MAFLRSASRLLGQQYHGSARLLATCSALEGESATLLQFHHFIQYVIGVIGSCRCHVKAGRPVPACVHCTAPSAQQYDPSPTSSCGGRLQRRGNVHICRQPGCRHAADAGTGSTSASCTFTPSEQRMLTAQQLVRQRQRFTAERPQ